MRPKGLPKSTWNLFVRIFLLINLSVLFIVISVSSIAPTEEPKTTPLLAALSEQKQAAQEKKVIAESARAQARRAAAPAPVATAPPSKPEVEATAPGKRTRRGKGSQAAGAAAVRMLFLLYQINLSNSKFTSLRLKSPIHQLS